MPQFKGNLKLRDFKVSIPNQDLEDFKNLLKLSKIGPQTFENSSGDESYGLSRSWVSQAKDRWLNGYDWRKTEDRINSFQNYKAYVSADNDEQCEVHFLALVSQKADAIPIVLLHGWPGSPLEFLDLLDLAKAKYSDSDLPYTFIVPSLPGYGFSDNMSTKVLGTCESMAYVVDQLMAGLGFADRYFAQGGDIGSFVARILAARHGARAAHINFALMPPPDNVPLDDISSSELEGLRRAAGFGAQGDAYAREHGQRPATIGLLLSTSPLALLIWIGEKFLEWSDSKPDLDQILDSVTLYWFTDSFPRSIYPYRQFFGPNPEAIPLKHAVEKPVGYSWFPKEIAPIPRAWVATTCNLVWYKQHTKGGHFAAMEMPKELLEDIESFVKQVFRSDKAI